MNLQLKELFPDFDRLQTIFGDKNLMPIYGAGCVKNPKLFLVFMNPTAKNIASSKDWPGIRAPWLGTKNIWKLLAKLSIISKKQFTLTQNLEPNDWTPIMCLSLYSQVASNKVYITNLAKCTQLDARCLKDQVFKQYLGLIRREIALIQPKNIITFGNQVSSILLEKKVSVSKDGGTPQQLSVKNNLYKVYPIYYPVGQGMRNIGKAARAIGRILKED